MNRWICTALLFVALQFIAMFFTLLPVALLPVVPSTAWMVRQADATELKPTALNSAEAQAADTKSTAPDTVLVCPKPFLPTMQPWVEHRQQQGHVIAVVPSELTATGIRAEIRRHAAGGKLRWVLLVGDAEPPGKGDPLARARLTPTYHIPAKVNVKWGSEPEIATDNLYADLDDDQIPDVAIGRLTADNPRDLSLMVKKILDYERSVDFSAWRKRVNFVAGVGGFGVLADTVLETATKTFLTEGIPAAYHTSMTYGSWRSPYCPDPRRFHDVTVNRLNEGCLFWVYIGHGHPLTLDRVKVPGATYPIFQIGDAGKLKAAAQPPIAVMLACYTAAFDLPRDCLGEELLKTEGGPIAVLGGSRVTMPYAMAVMSHGLLEETFRHHTGTLGEVLLQAKRRMMANEQDDQHRQLLDAIATLISPSAGMLEDERREHLALFNLLGDPLLQIHHPEEVQLKVPAEDLESGETLEIVAHSPIAGRGHVELVCRRDRFRLDLSMRDTYDSASSVLDTFQDVYRAANNRRWQQVEVEWSEPGTKTIQIPIPANAFGPSHVTLHVEGDKQHALGSANVFIRRTRDKSTRYSTRDSR
ncbi:MAG: C25 family cysteine peptidase [Planctomycetota bacterium]